MIVVTGGSGFIGTALVKKLEFLGKEVRIIDTNIKEEEGEPVDITDKKAIKKVIGEGDTVIHLAALINAHKSNQEKEKYFKVNILGTKNIVEICEERGCKKLIFPSSAAVYDPNDEGEVNEKTKTNPSNYYGLTKVEGEKLVLSAKIPKTVLRFSNAYGKGGKGIVNNFIEKAKSEKPLIIWGSGNQERDFIHIDDIVDSIILAMKKGEGLYNISTFKNISINDLAELVQKVSEKNLTVKHIEVDETESHYKISNGLAKKELRFSPKVSLEEGIRRLL